MHSAASDGYLEVVRLLLEAGADKNAARSDGVTALWAAGRHGHLEVVRLLLEADSDKNARHKKRQPLCWLQLVTFPLLKAGADKNAGIVDEAGGWSVRLHAERVDGATAGNCLLAAAWKGHLVTWKWCDCAERLRERKGCHGSGVAARAIFVSLAAG